MRFESALGRFKSPVELSTPVGLPPTVPERCLLYLLDRVDVREDDAGAQELTQVRIAEALLIRRSHVSRAMGRLQARGLVKPAKIHVRGEPRRRLAHFLTEEGLRRSQALRRRFEEERVTVVDVQGKESSRRLYEVRLLLPKRTRFSDLLSSMEDRRLDLRQFLDRRSRLKGGRLHDASEASVPPHFQDRREELARLDAFLGDPQVRGLLLVGLPGVGKTAVASRWVAALRGRDHVLWRRLRPETTARDLIRGVAEVLRAAGRPALSDFLQRPPDRGPDLSLSILRRDVAEVRALLVFDDAHVTGKEVGALVNELLHVPAEHGGLKVLLLARERLGFLRAEDSARGRVWEIELMDLPEPDARALLRAMEVSPSLQDEILRRCGGHPLALELAAAGRLPLEGVRRTSASWFAEEALSRLAPPARDALALAAVMRGPVAIDLLGPHARELARRCLIREVEGRRMMIHDLVREAVLQGLPAKRRSTLHVRAGRMLAGGEGPSDALAAIRHFVVGEAFGLAESVAAQRGEEIVEAGLAEALVPLLDRRVWTASEDPRRPRIQLLRGHALFALGRWSEAVRAYEECAELRDTATLPEALLGQGKAEVQRGSRLALPLLLAARDRFEGLGALRRLAEAQYWIGGVHEDAGHADEAREAFERGRAVAFDVGDRRWEGLCAYGIGRLQAQRNDHAGAADTEEEALRLLEREGSRLDIAKVCAGLGGNLLELGRTEEAEAYLGRAASEARATGAMGVLASALYNLASLRRQSGRVPDAIPLFVEALTAFEEQEQYEYASRCAAWLAFGEWALGRENEGDRYARRASALLVHVGGPALRARALRHLGRACWEVGRKDDARRYLRRAVEEARDAKLEQLRTDLSEELGRFA